MLEVHQAESDVIWIFFVPFFHILPHQSFFFVFAPSACWSMWHPRMNGHEMGRTGKVIKFPGDGVFLVRWCRGLGALSPPPSLCPSLTGWLSDIAVILSLPFICLPNGNPPCFLFTFSFPFFSFASVPFLSLRPPLWRPELLAVLLIGLGEPNFNDY